MIVAGVEAVTVPALTANVPVVDPTATETEAGSVALLEEDVSFTTIAPLLVPGAAFSVTVPVAEAPL